MRGHRTTHYRVLNTTTLFLRNADKSDTTSEETDFQDLNHLNPFDNDYLEIPYDDERVESEHACNGSFSPHLGNNVESDIAFFNNSNENSPLHRNNNICASEGEEIATLDENQENCEGSLNQNSNF
ncbi:hypothetical protein Tco_0438684, partial [Tanacetum coccineum]